MAEIVNEAMFCSSFDATNGYFQIPLHTASQHLTTFMTHWGRYKFMRASMGFCSSCNECNRREEAAFGTLQNTVRVVDDILRYDRSFPSPIEGVVCAILQAMRAEKITLNADKFKFAQKKLVWAVYETQHGGVTVDHSELQAIA